ncbi:MAG: ATP-binding protein [Paludibacteraceae bacterium]|nr:ATP-binding protein [Paludibacteraceae bacterium]
MGLYLNPNADAFQLGLNSEIYVDKSLVLAELNKLACTQGNFICMSRPRRFGKSMVGNLISAYYSKGCDTRSIFSQMKIGQTPDYDKYLNKLNVIKLDLNGWYQRSIQGNRTKHLLTDIHKALACEFKEEFPTLKFSNNNTLDQCILKVYAKLGEKFVIIIDEYDVLVRENVPQDLFDNYLSFLNGLFKDTTLRPAIALAYITGIMPIVRDKVQSKLNEFSEYTMLRPRQFAGMIGFTEEEVKDLCEKYHVDFDECLRWYDGYQMSDNVKVCNPLSVINTLTSGEFDNYWLTTGSFEALRERILMDYEGMRQDVIKMISGESVPVNVLKFQNTLQSINSKDNVFTYLIHLGYLCYNRKDKTCHIPNEEVRIEWINSIEDSSDYTQVMKVINASKRLLDDTINGNEEAVARALNAAHTEVTNPLTYNDEHCFQSAICLAYFYANTRYTLIKELPTGKGYADLVLVPYLPNIPAMVVELKHNKSTESALGQIKAKNYHEALNLYYDNLLFVGINYDEKTKEHTCKIERFVKE